ncbi:amidohydrolase family protein [Nocardia sp. R16R-3T]
MLTPHESTPDRELVITGARIVTLDDTNTVIRNGFIRISGDTIVGIGPSEDYRARPGVTVIDANGLVALPGLVNAHMHFHYRRCGGTVGPEILGPPALDALRSTRTAFNMLREGVTSVRDLGHDDHSRLHVRDAIDSGMIVGPTATVSGAALGMPYGHADFVAERVNGIQDLVVAIRRQAHEGADLIKIIASNEDLPNPPGKELSTNWYSREAIDIAVETAHECGLPIAAHAIGTRTIEWCIEAGVDTIEHGIYLQPDQAKAMVERNISMVPTLSGYYENSRTYWGRAWQPRYAALWEVHRETISNAVEAGVRIGLGTDTLGTMVLEAHLLHTFGGASPLDALEAATRGGAAIVGRQKEIGSLETGKRADIVLIDGSPEQNLKDLAKVRHTVVGGVAFSREELSKVIPGRHKLYVDEWDGSDGSGPLGT